MPSDHLFSPGGITVFSPKRLKITIIFVILRVNESTQNIRIFINHKSHIKL